MAGKARVSARGKDGQVPGGRILSSDLTCSGIPGSGRRYPVISVRKEAVEPKRTIGSVFDLAGYVCCGEILPYDCGTGVRIVPEEKTFPLIIMVQPG